MLLDIDDWQELVAWIGFATLAVAVVFNLVFGCTGDSED